MLFTKNNITVFKNIFNAENNIGNLVYKIILAPILVKSTTSK